MAKRKLVAASVPQLSQTVREITSERAGSMSEAERKDLHELLTVTAAALSEDESRKAEAAKSAEAQRVAKRQRVAAASKDAGARLNMGALQCLKGDVAAKCIAFLRAEDFRSLAQIKCDEVSAGVLRSGVAMACAAIAPYASPPQLTLGTCGWEPLAVLEDAMARADSFYASQPRRPWARLLRVRARSSLVVGGVLPAPNPAFESDDEGPIQDCQTFHLDIASYCSLDDCPVTAPRPRCERDATVAAAVFEILRRAPDKLVAKARHWLEQWLRKFLESDSLLRTIGRSRDGDKVVLTQTRLWLLFVAGFAPAMKAAFESARLVETVNALAQAFGKACRYGHDGSLLADRTHLYRWRETAHAALEALLSCTKTTNVGVYDTQCRHLWNFLNLFCCGASRIRTFLLPADVMWDTIVAWDPETPILAWATGKLDPVWIGGLNGEEPHGLACLHGLESMIYCMNWLALCLPAVARRVLSLGGLEACERVLASDVRLASATSRHNIENLHATLLDSTRPPKKAKSRAEIAFDRERDRQTRLHLGWPEDLEVPLGDSHTIRTLYD